MSDQNLDLYVNAPALPQEKDLSPELGSKNPESGQIQSLAKELDETFTKVWYSGHLVISDPQELKRLNNFLTAIPGFNRNYQLNKLKIYRNYGEMNIVGMSTDSQNFDLKIDGSDTPSLINRYRNDHLKDKHLYQICRFTLALLKEFEGLPNSEITRQMSSDFSSLVQNHPAVVSEQLAGGVINEYVVSMSSGDLENANKVKHMENVLKDGILKESDSLKEINFYQATGVPSNGEIEFVMELSEGKTARISAFIHSDGGIGLGFNAEDFENVDNTDMRIRLDKFKDNLISISFSGLSKIKVNILREANRILSNNIT